MELHRKQSQVILCSRPLKYKTCKEMHRKIGAKENCKELKSSSSASTAGTEAEEEQTAPKTAQTGQKNAPTAQSDNAILRTHLQSGELEAHLK